MNPAQAGRQRVFFITSRFYFSGDNCKQVMDFTCKSGLNVNSGEGAAG